MMTVQTSQKMSAMDILGHLWIRSCFCKETRLHAHKCASYLVDVLYDRIQYSVTSFLSTVLSIVLYQFYLKKNCIKIYDYE